MIARAAKNLEKDKTEELRRLVFRLKDILRVALNNDGPPKVKSLCTSSPQLHEFNQKVGAPCICQITPRGLISLHVWSAGAGEGLTRKESLTKNISSEFFWTSRHHKCRWATEMFGSSGLDENFDSRICLKWPFYRKNHWRQFKFISDTRNHEINSAFRNVKASIPESIHHDPEKLMCLFTNASDNHWVILLTQVPKAFLSCSMLAQDHQPIAVLSWSFNGSERRLSVIAKETFSIIEASEKLRHFLLTTQNLRVFTLWYIKTSFTLCFPMHDRAHFGRLIYLGRFFVSVVTSHQGRPTRCYDGT